MSMNYTSLVAPKGIPGSIANWVSFSLLDLPPIIDEAQALLFSRLRVREMRSDRSFTIPQGGASVALPVGFLDPIGKIRLLSINSYATHKDMSFVQGCQNYSELSGTLGTNPFTTAVNSLSVTVTQTGHGLSQDSVFNTSGATAFNGATIVGTFPVASITDANNFVIDITSLGATPSSGGAGGGSAVSYIVDNLVQGTPSAFGIWNERINFDVAFSQTSLCKLQFYRSLPLLSATNLTNFLTDRYPHVMRWACTAAAADFMQDDGEYQKCLTRLEQMIMALNIENDGSMRGMDISVDNP